MTPAQVSAPAAAGGFRSDINGLRAVAIAAVVAFHLARGVAPGGFVGVDVFFVISGYLMTNIIVGRVGQGRFTLWGFYLDRLRRIAPALLALCLGLWIFGALAIDPWTFQDIAGKIPEAALFVSNIAFATGGGYFALNADRNWLLHTWSLSLEWQFYLVYPLLLAALARWPATWRARWIVLAAIGAASLGLALAMSGAYSSFAFYLLPTRAWELLLGGLCSAAEGRLRLAGAWRWALHLAGLVLIGLGVWIARPSVGWPSAVTLLPTVGTAVVILSNLRRTFWAETWAVGWLGRASYSIYLWHWPVVVWMAASGIALTPAVAAAALAAMLALGVASYWLIERWASNWLFPRSRQPRWLAGGAVLGMVLIASVAAAQTHGLEALRTLGDPPEVRAALADDRHAWGDWAFPKVCGRIDRVGALSLCRLGDPAARQVLVMGDSHADQIAPRYAHAFDGKPGAGVSFLTTDGCIPIPGVAETGHGARCAVWWRQAYAWAETAGFSRIVIASSWPLYYEPTAASPVGDTCIEGPGGCAGPGHFATPGKLADAEFALLADEVRRLQAHGAQVVLIGTTPDAAAGDPRALYTRLFWTRDLTPLTQSRAAYAARTAMVRAQLVSLSQTTGSTLLDPLDGFCPNGLCPITADGRAIYKDYGHFRASLMPTPRFAYLDAAVLRSASPRP